MFLVSKKEPLGGPLFLRVKIYLANQLSTSSAPYWLFQSFRVLWLPPFVSTSSPEWGFL